jgi:hypothetical protein
MIMLLTDRIFRDPDFFIYKTEFFIGAPEKILIKSGFGAGRRNTGHNFGRKILIKSGTRAPFDTTRA